jgi:integrase
MAETIEFTVRSIEAIKPPPAGRVEYKDSKTPGLYLRVTHNGIKTFSFVGRAKGSSRVERATIGKYPAVKPDEARNKARSIAGGLADGVSAAAASRKQRGELTLGELFKLYRDNLELKGKGTESPDALWETHIAPHFASRRLSEIKASSLERWHRGIPAAMAKRHAEDSAAKYEAAKQRHADILAARAIRRRGPAPMPLADAPAATPEGYGQRTANLALSLVRAMFNWALEPRRALFSGINPAAKHDLFPEVDRDRFLHPDELKPFFEALAEAGSETMRDFILLALLTGARRSNVAAMQWKDLNLERGEWAVSGAQMKNGKPQTITLGPEAVAILQARLEAQGQATRAAKAQREGQAKNLFVFPSDKAKSGHIQDPRKTWGTVLKKAGISNLRIHDLRRTLGSWQARTGASLAIIGKSLNHKSLEATAIYAQLDLDPVRQSVERATSAMFDAAGLKDSAQVLTLPSAGGLPTNSPAPALARKSPAQGNG